MSTKKIISVIGISGSLRGGSYNRKLLKIAVQCAKDGGCSVQEIDLKTINLPIYDGDIEAQELPESVIAIKEIVAQADVILIATPEYNYSIPGGLKNFIDWLSRGDENSLDGKVAAIFGVSSGAIGTARAQLHLRQIFTMLNVFALPKPEVYIRFGGSAFNEDGSLKDPQSYALLRTLVLSTIDFAKKNSI